jgi:hypothetical protein
VHRGATFGSKQENHSRSLKFLNSSEPLQTNLNQFNCPSLLLIDKTRYVFIPTLTFDKLLNDLSAKQY